MSFFSRQFTRSRRAGAALTRVNYDFTAGTLPAGLTCVRNSSACYKWDGSALTQFAANAPFLFGAEGLWCPGQFDQHIQNNGLAGAAVGQIGSGGAIPTTWSYTVSGGTTTRHITTLTPSAGRPVIGLRSTNTSGTVTLALYPFANATSPYRPIAQNQYIICRGWWRNASGNVPPDAGWRWRASIASTDGGAEVQTVSAYMPAVPTGSNWEPFAVAIRPTGASTAFIRALWMLTNTSAPSPTDITLEFADLDVQIADWPASDFDLDRPVRVIGTATSHLALTSPEQVIAGSFETTRLTAVHLIGRAAAGRKTGVNQTLASFGLGGTPDLISIYRRASDAKLCVYQNGVETVAQQLGTDIVLADGATFSATVAVPASAIRVNTVRLGAAGDGSAPFWGYIRQARVNPSHPDWTPDAFSLPAYTDVVPGSGVYSRSFTVSGIAWDCPTTITAPGEYRVNGGAWTTGQSLLVENDTVEVRLTAGAGYGESVATALTIGTVTEAYSVTTAVAPSDFALDLTNWPTANRIPFTRRRPTNIRVVGTTPAETPALDQWVVALAGDDGLIEVYWDALTGRLVCRWGESGMAVSDAIGTSTTFDMTFTLTNAPAVDRYWIGENVIGTGDWTGAITAVRLNDTGVWSPPSSAIAWDNGDRIAWDNGDIIVWES